MQPFRLTFRLPYKFYKTTIIMKYQFALTLTLLLSFSLLNNTFAQKTTEEARKEFEILKEELRGYVQIQMINTRSKPSIELDLLKQIKTVHERITKEEFIQVSPFIRIKVLPKNAFPIKDSENIVYISE